jgi:hypothetical protein
VTSAGSFDSFAVKERADWIGAVLLKLAIEDLG